MQRSLATTKRNSSFFGSKRPIGPNIFFKRREYFFFYFCWPLELILWDNFFFIRKLNRNATELYEWVSTINLVAAMFSSPPLSGGIGSSKTFQRPMLPVAKTRYTLQEQFEYYKKHVKQLQLDLTKLESVAGACLSTYNSNQSTNSSKDDKSFDKDKYNYLKFEVSDDTSWNICINIYHVLYYNWQIMILWHLSLLFLWLVQLIFSHNLHANRSQLTYVLTPQFYQLY